MTQKAIPQMGSNEATSGSGLPPSQEASTALKAGIVSGARNITSEVKHVASDVASDAKKAAESKLGAGKDFAAERLGAVAYALRHTSQQLRLEESGITEYVEKAASSVDSVSHYLQTRTLSQLIGDVEGYARRPQVQERLTMQIADALMEELAPIGAACVIEAVHTCMTIRGAKKHGSTMVTSALRGIFKENPASRAEVLSLIHSKDRLDL